MNNHLILLGYTFTVGLAEIIIFMLAAVILGFCIHFYWANRSSVSGIPKQAPHDDSRISEEDRERLQLYEQIDKHDKDQERLEKEILRLSEAEKMLIRELDDARDEIKRLEQRAERAAVESGPSKQHMSELVMAQQHLHESLSKEISERLSKAYEEFTFLQDRIQKMQAQLFDPHKRNIKIEELEHSYARLTKEYDELRLKHLSLIEEHQQLIRTFGDNEEKLKEVSFEKQQLSRKVAFLEEMVSDLQQVTGHNKKLEGQLRRLSEIEKLLSRTGNA